MKNTIIFDLDGTLLNTGLTFHTIVNELKFLLKEKKLQKDIQKK